MAKQQCGYKYHVKVFYHSNPDDPWVFDIDDFHDFQVDKYGFVKIVDCCGCPHNLSLWNMLRIELEPFKLID